MPKSTLQTFAVNWDDTKELIVLDGPFLKGQILHSSEQWKGFEDLARYILEVESVIRKGKTNTVELRYKEKPQRDSKVKDPKNKVGWGKTILIWDDGATEAEAEWVDDDLDSDRSGETTAKIVYSQGIKAGPRQTALVARKLRPRQKWLRDTLITRDMCCALSGEEEQAVLDAAHILEVKNDGDEVPQNAILLRADLHRLFDCGLIWFSITKDAAKVKYSPDLPRHYREELKNGALPDHVFKRVVAALRKRALP